MEVKKGYKKTDVGIIPNEWRVKLFSEVADAITCGVAATPKYVSESEGKPFLSASNVQNERVITNEIKFIPHKLFSQITKINKPERGDILYTRVGAGIGEAGVVEVDFEFAIYVSLTLIKPKKSLNSYFLKALLNSNHYRFLAKRDQFAGGGVQNLNVQVVKDFPIPLPSLKEQTAIATALSDTDELISTLEKLIAKKRNIKQVITHQLLQPKNDWLSASIEKMCIPNGLVRGPFGGALKKEFFVERGIKVYEQRNAIYRDSTLGHYYIDSEKYNELKRFEVKGGDFIVSCSGTIGRIFQIPMNSQKGIINQALLKITLNTTTFCEKYFYYYFSWDKFQSKITESTQGGAMKNLVGMPIFKTTEIFLPPSKGEQLRIATALSDLDDEIAALESKLIKYGGVKQGMMQNLLTGKIRLV